MQTQSTQESDYCNRKLLSLCVGCGVVSLEYLSKRKLRIINYPIRMTGYFLANVRNDFTIDRRMEPIGPLYLYTKYRTYVSADERPPQNAAGSQEDSEKIGKYSY